MLVSSTRGALASYGQGSDRVIIAVSPLPLATRTVGLLSGLPLTQMTASSPEQPAWRPLLMAAPRAGDGTIALSRGAEEIIVRTDPDVFSRLAARCDGFTELEDVLAGFEGEEAMLASELLRRLRDHDIVVDARHAFRHLHHLASLDRGQFGAFDVDGPQLVPTTPPRTPTADDVVHVPGARTPLTRLLERRASADGLSTGRDLDARALATIVGCGYRRRLGGGATVPSAGALYPLTLFVGLRTAMPPLNSGLWRWSPETGEFTAIDSDYPSPDTFIPDAETAALACRARAILIVVAETQSVASKYANRGYLYVALEAGAVMQNVYLAAAEGDMQCGPSGASSMIPCATRCPYLRVLCLWCSLRSLARRWKARVSSGSRRTGLRSRVRARSSSSEPMLRSTN